MAPVLIESHSKRVWIYQSGYESICSYGRHGMVHTYYDKCAYKKIFITIIFWHNFWQVSSAKWSGTFSLKYFKVFCCQVRYVQRFGKGKISFKKFQSLSSVELREWIQKILSKVSSTDLNLKKLKVSMTYFDCQSDLKCGWLSVAKLFRAIWHWKFWIACSLSNVIVFGHGVWNGF